MINSFNPGRVAWATAAATFVLLLASVTSAQQPSAPPAANTSPAGGTPPPAAPVGAEPAASQPLKPEELDQLAAPIALYPDSLLAQILMASTYPLEVVQAERWVKANPSLKGDALADALNKQTWDASVKSLVNFPQVLTMMNEKLDWMIKLGDAFIADQKAVMDAVQRLRFKAKDNGNLQSNQEQTVTVEQAPAAAAPNQPAQQTIVIQSAQPNVVYVPTYNPTVVYGTWPYPAYPPVYYTPPGYTAAAAAISFGAGVALGAAWGHAWGHCNWHGGDVDVDVNRNVNYNRSIDRNAARTNIENRTRNTAGARTNSFRHDPAHRGGAPYRDAATNQRYRGNAASQQTAQARNAYRGRAEAGRQDIARGGASAYRGGTGGPTAANRGGAAAGTYNRQAGSYNRPPSTPRPQTTGTRSSGFSGAGSGAANTRAASARGQSSRSNSAYSRPSGGGGARMGGGSRGGGRGGGGRGGGRR